MVDVAQGLHYLHTMEPTIIHGDLKSVSGTGYTQLMINSWLEIQVNILITHERRACLVDFGYSRASESKALTFSYFSDIKSGGSWRWKAPELFSDDDTQPPVTDKSDIYAFACVCYEVQYL